MLGAWTLAFALAGPTVITPVPDAKPTGGGRITGGLAIATLAIPAHLWANHAYTRDCLQYTEMGGDDAQIACALSGAGAAVRRAVGLFLIAGGAGLAGTGGRLRGAHHARMDAKHSYRRSAQRARTAGLGLLGGGIASLVGSRVVMLVALDSPSRAQRPQLWGALGTSAAALAIPTGVALIGWSNGYKNETRRLQMSVAPTISAQQVGVSATFRF